MRKTILCIDDDRATAAQTARQFTERGHAATVRGKTSSEMRIQGPFREAAPQ